MEQEMMFRIFLAAVFGGCIGYVREIERKSAGLRTHILVCVGSALFTLVSIHMAMMSVGADTARIASNVVTGIGFLGAGAIFQSGGSVKGLTTAASIWIVAAIGLSVGSGMYLVSTFSTILALIIIKILHYYEIRYLKVSKEQGDT